MTTSLSYQLVTLSRQIPNVLKSYNKSELTLFILSCKDGIFCDKVSNNRSISNDDDDDNNNNNDDDDDDDDDDDNYGSIV